MRSWRIIKDKGKGDELGVAFKLLSLAASLIARQPTLQPDSRLISQVSCIIDSKQAIWPLK